MSLCHTCIYRALRQIGNFAIWGCRKRKIRFGNAKGMEAGKLLFEEPKVGDGGTAVTREMITAAHGVTLETGDVVLSAKLLERIYKAMAARQPLPRNQPSATCKTCEALARTVMMDQTGAA